RKLRYVREDDKCQPADAIGAVKKLIHEHKVFMIHGGGCSNASLAAKPEIEQAKVPWVITASTADTLTDPRNPYIFTTMLAAWMEAVGQVEHAFQLNAKRIAIVSQRDAWGRARYQPLLDALTKGRKTQPVADEELPVDPSDATAVALRVQAAKPDVVLLVLFPKAAAIYMRDAFKVGFTPITLGGSTIGDVDKFEKDVGIPGSVNKLRSITAAGYTPDEPKLAEWKKAVEAMYPGEVFSIWHMFGISSGQFVVEALKRTGRDLTREKLIQVMSNLTVPVDTYGGPISCTPTDSQCHRTPAWFGLESGKVKLMGYTTVTPIHKQP
ncbi:MAG: ABC transporter substrate-binding protein, partial [Alphaproteobacteria bacterium]|nr:ABC transporter substrate-binding protein [Alphaproteobacteria bacterium]